MGKTNDLKMFTLEEANRLLPFLEQKLADLRGKRDVIKALEVEIDALELIVEKDDSGASPVLTRKVDEYTNLLSRFYAVVDEIHSSGCLLKDLDTGLIDFYSLKNNQVVFLCWKSGEPSIGFWHEVGGGYASRRALP